MTLQEQSKLCIYQYSFAYSVRLPPVAATDHLTTCGLPVSAPIKLITKYNMPVSVFLFNTHTVWPELALAEIIMLMRGIPPEKCFAAHQW
jgi:hypothetical protein